MSTTVESRPGRSPWRRIIPLAGGLCLAAGVAWASSGGRLALLEGGDPSEWSSHSFEGRTLYERVVREGREALQAKSVDSASLLYRRLGVELSRTPVMSWSWLLDEVSVVEDERARGGDDFPLRLIVTARDAAGDRRALSYVWARGEPVGSSWPNPHAAETTVIVASSGPPRAANEWQAVRRDVAADFLRHHGLVPREIELVAIMSDTDDAGGRACALLADLALSSR